MGSSRSRRPLENDAQNLIIPAMYTLAIAVPLILIFSYLVSNIRVSTKFCPTDMKAHEKERIDASTNCNGF
jgi:hypothetical protein